MTRVTLAFDKRSARSFDADGRMRVQDCILSTAEVNPYRGEEIPGWENLGLKPGQVYDLYRDPAELGSAAASFEGVPLLVKHIPQTADEPRKEYIGGSIHSVSFDGKHLRGSLLVMDGYAIDLIESNVLADLSCGYRYTPDMTAGKIGDIRYDGVMRTIQGNHVALVDEGRASDAHVADAAFRNPQGPDPTMPGAHTMPITEPSEQTAEPGAVTPPPGSPAGEANEQINMAAIGQALKRIAELLENIHAKVGGATPAAEPAATTAAPGAETPVPAAEDFSLNKATEGKEGSFADAKDAGEETSGEVTPVQTGESPGLEPRGRTMVAAEGAMDAKSVSAAIATAVATERARAAAVATAAREVRGVLGDVIGMDDAGAIYREALKQAGVDVAGLPAGTERAAWQAYAVVRRAAHAGHESVHVMDSKVTDQAQSVLLGHLAKISVKG